MSASEDRRLQDFRRLFKDRDVYAAKLQAMNTSIGNFARQYKELPSLEELSKLNFVDLSPLAISEGDGDFSTEAIDGKDAFRFLDEEQSFALLPPFSECLFKVSSEVSEIGTVLEDFYHIKVLEVEKDTGRALLDVQIYWKAVNPPYPAALMPVQRYIFSFDDNDTHSIDGLYEGTCMWLYDFVGRTDNFVANMPIIVNGEGTPRSHAHFPADVEERLKVLQRRCNISNEMEMAFLNWAWDILSAIDPVERLRRDIGNIGRTLLYFNYLLSKHRCVQAKDYDTMRAANPFNLRIDRKDERVVRRLGTNVIVRSVESPKRSDKEHGVTYKLSSWSRRGHARHYKSGKVIWINEQEVHRKAFDGEESGTVANRDYVAVPPTLNTKGGLS